MRTFLDQVAQTIIKSKMDFQALKIVVPSNRAILFLKEAIKKRIETPRFAPKVISIESFIEELSGLKKISKSELILLFFETYREITPEKKQDQFDQYLGWAETILNEFSEIDANLVDSSSLFRALGDYKSLDFWNADTLQEKDIVKNFKDFNKILPKLYQKVHEILLDKEQAYSGLRYREAVANLEYYFEADQRHHFFIGFNALNKAEEFLFQEFLAKQRATVLWDIDSCFYQDLDHPAGHFIRHYFKHWPVFKREKPLWVSQFEEEKNIHIVGLPKNISQAHCAVQLLGQLKADESKALVLGEESLLIPTLSALNNNFDSWNVTMGYPMEHTPAANFFDLFMKLHEEAHSESYDFRHLLSLLSSVHLEELLKAHEINIHPLITKFHKKRQFRIAASELFDIMMKKVNLLALLFKPIEGLADFLKRTIELSIHFIDFFSSKGSNQLLASFFKKQQAIFENLQNIIDKYPFVRRLTELRLLYQNILNQEKIPFSGDPLEGLQIMGLLETRLLDFDNVVITNLNEGILPSGKSFSSWIPFAIKKEFEMPTFLEKDYLYAYHFFRLLQRAKRVYLLYNSISEGINGGEKSRFIYQLEYLKKAKHKLHYSQLDIGLSPKKKSFSEVQKTPEIVNQLWEMAISGFSPSSLTTFLKDPYLFYERYLLKINPSQPLEQTLQANQKGTLIHTVLEQLYTPFIQQELRIQHYDKMLKNVSPLVDEIFQKEFGSSYSPKGKNYLLFESIIRLIKHFLEEERKWIANNNHLKIIAVERKIEGFFSLTQSNKKIKLKGYIDRIDQVNDVLRIVDYKTGSVNSKQLQIDQWENLLHDSNKTPLFQILLYSYMLKSEFENRIFYAGVIPFKTLKNDFIPARIGSERLKELIIFSKKDNEAFATQLSILLDQLFDTNIPFIRKN
tara:strand:+ start:2121 stop:4847 length:2727 start_codon:yes stop_codon:yes gene_type:complete